MKHARLIVLENWINNRCWYHHWQRYRLPTLVIHIPTNNLEYTYNVTSRLPAVYLPLLCFHQLFSLDSTLQKGGGEGGTPITLKTNQLQEKTYKNAQFQIWSIAEEGPIDYRKHPHYTPNLHKNVVYSTQLSSQHKTIKQHHVWISRKKNNVLFPYNQLPVITKNW